MPILNQPSWSSFFGDGVGCRPRTVWMGVNLLPYFTSFSVTSPAHQRRVFRVRRWQGRTQELGCKLKRMNEMNEDCILSASLITNSKCSSLNSGWHFVRNSDIQSVQWNVALSVSQDEWMLCLVGLLVTVWNRNTTSLFSNGWCGQIRAVETTWLSLVPNLCC